MLMFFGILLTLVVSQHDHTGEWEAEAAFSLSGHYAWTFEKVGGSYADEHMIVALVPMDNDHCDSHELEEVEEEVAEMWEVCEEELEHEEEGGDESDDHEGHDHGEHSCSHTENGESLVVGNNATIIEFDDNSWVTVVYLEYTGCVGMFLAHLPEEFNSVLAKSDQSETLTFEGHDDEEEDKNWGAAIGANIICTLPTLMSLLFIGQVREFLQKNLVFFLQFALGVLLSTALFHIYPEAMMLVDFSDEMGEETAEIYKFWTTGLVAMTAIIPLIVGRMAREPHTDEGETDVEVTKPEAGALSKFNSTTISILLGDAVHNFVDGVVIGAAFMGCSDSFAWTITFGILAHEIAHEIADVFVLLSQGFSVVEVAALNFLSGIISVLGTVIIFASDVSSNVQGLFLVFGAAVFVAVALVDILPEVEMLFRRQGDGKWLTFIPFFVGAFLMGILLLNHEHCTGGDHGHSH